MARREKKGWQHYLTKAFTWRWNLLVFGGAVLAAAISGVPDIALPMILAAEITYLGALSGNPKFQKAIDVQLHKESKEISEAVQSTENRLDTMLATMDADGRYRFTDLRNRCFQMQSLAAGVRGHARADRGDDLHTEALNRMLWVFLRLLASQQSLQRFLETTDAKDMQTRVLELETRIQKAQIEKDDKILRALVDSMATAQLRLDNWQKAQHNAEFVEIELDRIEDKIQALVEMAVGHEDPDFISSQVDSVASEVSHTENAMREMSFMTGIEEEFEEAPPAILTVQA